jgi:tetratricopeptide (TPR) repeat protein
MIALVLTATVAIFIFLLRRRVRPLLVALGAFLVIIFPMIGFTQSGSQLFADRFTYLATIPFSVLLAVGLGRLRVIRVVVCGAIIIALMSFGLQTYIFSNTWSNNLTLWWRASSVDKDNAEAHNSTGLALMDHQQYEKALECFERAIQINPGYVLAWHNRALAKAMLGRYDQAFADWKIVLSLPDLPREVREKVLWIRGWVFEQTGDFKSAEADYSSLADDAMTTPVRRGDVLQLRAALYVRMGQNGKALSDLEAALKLPDLFGGQHSQAQSAINKINEVGDKKGF